MSLEDLVEELRGVAQQTGTYAYQFRHYGEFKEFKKRGVERAALVQVVVNPDGSHQLVACDEQGKPVDGPQPSASIPYSVGKGGVQSPPVPQVPQMPEDPPAPPVKRRWWQWRGRAG